MKTHLRVFVVLLYSVSLSLPLDSHQSTYPTRIEAALNQKGELFSTKRQRVEEFVGPLGNLSIDCYTLRFEENRKSLSGLKIVITNGSRLRSAYIDLVEIAPLTRTLTQIIPLIQRAKGQGPENRRMEYATNDQIRFMLVFNGSGCNLGVSTGDGGIHSFQSVGAIDSLRNAFVRAETLLEKE